MVSLQLATHCEADMLELGDRLEQCSKAAQEAVRSVQQAEDLNALASSRVKEAWEEVKRRDRKVQGTDLC